ncbi:MAG: hypothetical protein IJA32_05090 [Lachnospiraceae bacterium]|nr:hypothetical protein [Lachnospiraceae bacterium]
MTNNLFLLMNKNRPVALLEENRAFGELSYVVKETYDAYMPYGSQDINRWLDNRQAAKHRKHLKELMIRCGCYDKNGFINITHCTSLNDTFWVKSEKSDLKWEDVSLYTNPFDDTIARIAFDGVGLFGEQFSSTSPELTTEGSFEKCWIRENNNIYMIKRGSSGSVNAGMEPYSEVIVSQLTTAIGCRAVNYELVYHHKYLASKCKLFTSEQYGFVPMAAYSNNKATIQSVIDITHKLNCEEDFRRMLVIDAICYNIDRHAGNYGFIVNNDTGEPLKLAPLFDHNYALLPRMMEHDDAAEYLSLQGPRIGDDFTQTAIEVMTPDIQSELIKLKQFEYQSPGFGFPQWRLEFVNDLKNKQINAILDGYSKKKM